MYQRIDDELPQAEPALDGSDLPLAQDVVGEIQRGSHKYGFLYLCRSVSLRRSNRQATVAIEACLVSIDAMGADFLLAVKGNQPTPHDVLEGAFVGHWNEAHSVAIRFSATPHPCFATSPLSGN